MRKRRALYAVVLILALLFDDPQFAKAETVSDAFSSFDMSSFWDYGLELADEKKESYDITYYLNGGTENLLSVHSYSEEDLPLVLPIPEKTGYNFAGWYTESGFRNKISVIENSDYGDIALYAKWTRKINSGYNVQMYSYKTGSMVSGTDKELKNCEYDFVDNIEIPGMPSTREKDYMDNLIATYGQCPQGICITDEYYLVTAYCTDDDESLGSLYVFDKDSGEYLVTLGMKKRSHLGGLTFDGRNLWICHSDTRSLERISYAYLKKVAAMKPKAFVDATGLFEEYRVSNIPSCVTAYDGKLWVATHNIYFKSVMIAYQYRDGKLKEMERYRIPEKVQGIAFDVTGNVYLSTSYGRDKSSYLKVYDDVDAMDRAPSKPMCKVEMPPCSEELCIADGKVYVLFESASRKYFEGTDGKGSSIAPIDKILTVGISSIVNNQKG